MRRLERWLHQHIFKVGWLVTKNLHTTTILYYTLLLPGVVLHEFVYWFFAGIFNVRADRAIKWPEAQTVVELKLNFIQLERNAGKIRIALISITPLIAGIAVITLITNQVLQVPQFVERLQLNGLDDLPAALQQLTSATNDFWLWVYIVFTISNTMMPNFQNVKILRYAGIALMVAFVGLVKLSETNPVITEFLSGTFINTLNTLSGTFVIVIAIDLIMVAILGTIEAIIERITGDSATFTNGKMITIRREELLRQRQEEAAKQARQRERKAAARAAGPPSIYNVQFPIPNPPERGKMDIKVERETPAQLEPAKPAPKPASPPIITGRATTPEITREPLDDDYEEPDEIEDEDEEELEEDLDE